MFIPSPDLEQLANEQPMPRRVRIVAHGSLMQDFRLKEKRFPASTPRWRRTDGGIDLIRAHITVGNSLTQRK
jgi:hypothetical protein